MEWRTEAGRRAPLRVDSLVNETPGPRAGLSPRVFDPQRVLSLCNDDFDLAGDMIDLFLEVADSLVQSLKDALLAEHADAVQRTAHTLKGAAANLSGERLEATARQLMALGKRRDLGDTTQIRHQLDDELAKLTKVLTEFRASLDGRVA